VLEERGKVVGELNSGLKRVDHKSQKTKNPPLFSATGFRERERICMPRNHYTLEKL